MKPYKAVSLRRRPPNELDVEQDGAMSALFAALFEAWDAYQIASAPHIDMRQATTVLAASEAKAVWQRSAKDFRALWIRWERAQYDSADACYALLEGHYRLDWTDVNRRGRCLLETIGVNYLEEVLDAVAAMADECAYAWVGWLIGSDADALIELRDQWDAEGSPPDWQGIGMYRLLSKLGEEQDKRDATGG